MTDAVRGCGRKRSWSSR